MQLHGALINGLETRISEIESQLGDLDACGSEEHDNLVEYSETFRQRNHFGPCNDFFRMINFRSLLLIRLIMHTTVWIHR